MSFYELYSSPNPKDRIKVASNPKAPFIMLELLAKDFDARVQEAAQKNEKYILEKQKHYTKVEVEEKEFLANVIANKERSKKKYLNYLVVGILLSLAYISDNLSWLGQ